MPEPRSNTAAPTAAASTPSASSPKATSSRKRQEKSTQKTHQTSPLESSREVEAQITRAGTASPPAEKTVPGRVVSLTAIDRDGMISVAAYYRSEQRNFTPGFEVEDWLAAEAEIDALLLGSTDADTAPPV